MERINAYHLNEIKVENWLFSIEIVGKRDLKYLHFNKPSVGKSDQWVLLLLIIKK